MAGGAVVPLVIGALADHVGIQAALLLPAFSYVYVMFYGWYSR